MRKASGRNAARRCKADLADIISFLDEVDGSTLSKSARSRCYEIGLVKGCVALEKLILEALVVSINNDRDALLVKTGIRLPHLNRDASEFLIVGNGYFNFQGGKSGIMREVKQFLDDSHWLPLAIGGMNGPTTDSLVALRNWAAHESAKSKKKAQELIGMNAGTPGSYLKSNNARSGNRLRNLLNEVSNLADRIAASAPY